MKDMTVSINLPLSQALRVIDMLTGTATAAAAPTAAATVQPQHDPRIGVELDVTGAPWNGECHSDSKAKDDAGKWKGRRGCSAEKRATIEAQDRARLAGTPEPTMPPAAPALTAPALTAPAMPGMPAMPTMPAMPAMPAVAVPVSYEQLTAKYGELSASGRIDTAKWSELCAKLGVTNPADLTTNETIRAALYAEFMAL